jgi:hypothetical protein
VFAPTEQNLTHWRGWWRFAAREQLYTFLLISFLSIVFMSLLAYATVFGNPDAQNGIGFLQLEGQVLMERVGTWFGYFFWFVGALSLFAAALGIVDYTSRLAADVLKTMYFPDASESKIYAGLVWGLVVIGIIVISAGFSQPIYLAVISACVGGVMMFIYSGLLIVINKKMLPAPIRIRGFRVGVLVWSVVLFGVLAVLTVQQQAGRLLGQ